MKHSVSVNFLNKRKKSLGSDFINCCFFSLLYNCLFEKDTMKGVFWNMRGLGLDHKERYVRDMINDHNLDFIGVLETIKTYFSKSELHFLCGGKKLTRPGILQRGKSGGILVGWNKDFF